MKHASLSVFVFLLYTIIASSSVQSQCVRYERSSPDFYNNCSFGGDNNISKAVYWNIYWYGGNYSGSTSKSSKQRLVLRH